MGERDDMGEGHDMDDDMRGRGDDERDRGDDERGRGDGTEMDDIDDMDDGMDGAGDMELAQLLSANY